MGTKSGNSYYSLRRIWRKNYGYIFSFPFKIIFCYQAISVISLFPYAFDILFLKAC